MSTDFAAHGWWRGGACYLRSGLTDVEMKLIAEHLACVRGRRPLFSDLSFAVAAGQSLLLRGPNGSGKTSLIRILAGFLKPDTGTVRLEGAAEAAEVSELCHFVGHANGIKSRFTVLENLDFWSRYLGGGAADEALERFGLGDLADIPAGLLSAGQKRRLGLARLMLVYRPIWLLDEPTVSLDEASAGTLASLVDDHVAAGGLVVAATHIPLGHAFAQSLQLGPDSQGGGE